MDTVERSHLVLIVIGCIALASLVLWSPVQFFSTYHGQILGFQRHGEELFEISALKDAGWALKSLTNMQLVQFTGTHETAEEALKGYAAAEQETNNGHAQLPLLLITLGTATPTRRGPDQPFLSLLVEAGDPLSASTSGISLPVDAINAAVGVVEGVTGRRLFPHTLRVVDFAGIAESAGSARPLPVAVWDASSGEVLLDATTARRVWGSRTATTSNGASAAGSTTGGFTGAMLAPGHGGVGGAFAGGAAGAGAATADPRVGAMTGLLAEKLFGHLAEAVAKTAAASGPSAFASIMDHALWGPVVSGALAAAFAAAPPLWWCVACPALLGLLAPLLINIALNQVAGAICVQLKLADDQCFDLLMGALGLGFVLSLASAIPIFYVCRLMDCSHRNSTTASVMLNPGPGGRLPSEAASNGRSGLLGVLASAARAWSQQWRAAEQLQPAAHQGISAQRRLLRQLIGL